MHKLTRQASKRSEPATCCTCCKLPRLEGTQSAAARDRGTKPPPSTFRPSHLLASCECHDTSALAQNSTEHLALTENLSTNRKTPQAAQLLKNHIAVAPTFLANLKMTWWYSQLENYIRSFFGLGMRYPAKRHRPTPTPRRHKTVCHCARIHSKYSKQATLTFWAPMDGRACSIIALRSSGPQQEIRLTTE